jgi:hypothetical protein
VVEGYVTPQAAASEYRVAVDLLSGKVDAVCTLDLRRAGARANGAIESGIYDAGNTPMPIPG